MYGPLLQDLYYSSPLKKKGITVNIDHCGRALWVISPFIQRSFMAPACPSAGLRSIISSVTIDGVNEWAFDVLQSAKHG